MEVIHVGPTILSAIAWGCSLNIINSAALANKEGWIVPEIVYTSQYRTLGKVGMFISMFLAVLSAGWWGILITPAGGMLFGGITTAVLEGTMLAISTPIGIVASIGCVVWLYFVF